MNNKIDKKTVKKGLLPYLFLIVIMLGIFYFATVMNNKVNVLSYNEFVDKLEKGEIKELEVTTLMIYTDYKHTIGQNPDIAIKLAFDWLTDKDVAVKGAEKLAVYYDCIVEGEDE